MNCKRKVHPSHIRCSAGYFFYLDATIDNSQENLVLCSFFAKRIRQGKLQKFQKSDHQGLASVLAYQVGKSTNGSMEFPFPKDFQEGTIANFQILRM